MKVFISQTAESRLIEDFVLENQAIINIMKERYGNEVEIINCTSLCEGTKYDTLEKEVELIKDADIVAFGPGHRDDKRCMYEKQYCEENEIDIVEIPYPTVHEEYFRMAHLYAFGSIASQRVGFLNDGENKRADNPLKEDREPCYKETPITAESKPHESLLSDPVNHPSHYTDGKFECIDEMVIMFGAKAVYDFCICNAYKYQRRAGKKDGNSAEQDLAKKDWYLTKAKELSETI